MTTILRADSPAELLAYVPFRLGFRPAASVVLVSVRGRTVGLVARADTADVLGRTPAVRTLVDGLHRDGAASALLVVYADAPLGHARALAARVLARVRAGSRGLEVADAWVVTPSVYACVECPGCCPDGGRPVRDLEATRVAARLVLAGEAPAPTREAAYRVPAARPESVTSARRACERFRARGERAGDVTGAQHLAWRVEGFAAWQRALAAVGGEVAAPGVGSAQDAAARSAPAVPAVVLGRVAGALTCVAVRDAVLLTLVPGGGRTAQSTVRADDAPAVTRGTADAIAAIVDAERGVHPDASITGPAREVLEAVLAHSRGPVRAAPATLLGLLAWWHGDGGLARERLGTALDADPSYRLARLLESALAAGLPPGWVRAEHPGDGRTPWSGTVVD
ncbi:hypothetical protein Slu03_04000 [Sediminihabitans luteus]|nr:DUF4192 domain-containing protein [Sediminihabitans luteus]GII98022.1 hypothetical protein Slu03_04000 [Sediminihabitans luteus]